MPSDLQVDNQEPYSGGLCDQASARVTYVVRLQHWEERIVAGLAKEDRLQNVLEQGDNFYERIYRLCVRRKVPGFIGSPEQLGKSLAWAGNWGYGKRFISRVCGISDIESQKLLNQYYAVFPKIAAWIKETGREEAERTISSFVGSLLERSAGRCRASLPADWTYLGELTFSIPSDAYTVQIHKFLRHHFEHEVHCGDRTVRLPINIEALESLPPA